MDAFPIAVSTRRLVAAAVLVLALVALGARHLRAGPRPVALAVAPIRASGQAASRPRAAPGLVVDIEGEVRRPGLVRLAPGSRVADAVARAGGTTRFADRSGVNLAAPVSDGQQVLVPRRGSAGVGAPAPTATGGAAPSGPVSLSSATAEQLDTLPGVGPATAAAIISDREAHGPFRSVNDLGRVRGIGDAKLDQLRDLVTV